MRTPESASEITLDWLRNALPWERPGCEPVSVEVEPDFGGPSLLGRLARVRLSYATPECSPLSVIVVSFFLVKSLTARERRANEERLLQGYFELLPERARTEYGFDRFKLDYRACVTRSMLSAVMLVGPRFVDRPDRLALSDALAMRVIAAVQDLNPVDAITT